MDTSIKLEANGSPKGTPNRELHKLAVQNELHGETMEFLDSKPPVLESQIDIQYENLNENLTPPKLDLELVISSECEINKAPKKSANLAEYLQSYYETPKKLYIKMWQQNLFPKKLIVRLAKVKEIEILSQKWCDNLSGRLPDTKKSVKPKKTNSDCLCTHKTSYINYLGKQQHLYKTKDVVQCHMCPETFQTVQFLKKHVRKTHASIGTELWMKCAKCSCKTISRSQFGTRVRHSHTAIEKPFKCQYCSYRSVANDKVKRHELTHKDPSECTMYTCKECGYKTKFKCTLQTHILIHQKLDIRCTKCSYRGTNRKCVDAHMKAQHNKQYKTCQICEKIVDKRFLNTHLLAHTATKDDMFQCTKCNYSCLYRSNMERHKRRHNSDEDSKYKRCTECPYKSLESGNLKRHYLSIHSPDSNYFCDLCDFATNHKSSWRLHVDTQHTARSERKRLQCADCPKTYLTRQGLQLHIYVCHKSSDEKTRYKCTHCPYSCLLKQSLRVHLKNMHDEKNLKFETIFRCGGCKYEIENESVMERHIQEHHKHSEECQYEACEVPVKRQRKSDK